MDHFYVGKKFSSFDEIRMVMRKYKEETKVELVIRHCETLTRTKHSKVAATANRALVYHNLKLVCFRGGRTFHSRGKGFRNRHSLKVGCNAFITLNLSKCGQYLQVNQMSLQHNHKIEPRPPSRLEKRAEKRRLKLMHHLKVSYEEAVILERMKVSSKQRLVGPLEEEEHSFFDEKSSESSNNFKSEEVYSSVHRAMNVTDDEQSDTKEEKEDDNTRLSMDLNYDSNDSSDQDYNPLQRRIYSGKATNKRKYESDENDNEKEDHSISDDEDYRRPLIIHSNQPKTVETVDSDVFIKEENHSSTSKEDYHDMPLMRQYIFTKKGDGGIASTYSGIQKYKDDKVFEALGTIEELSSSIGHAKEFLPARCTNISTELIEVQCVLQDMVIHVGTPRSTCTEFHRVNSQFPEGHIIHLEELIKGHEVKLPSMTTIILPSGGQGSSALHVARSICRRAERRVVSLVREGEVDQTVIGYLNRLGDYLFVAARLASFISGKFECIYTQPSYNLNPITSANTSTNQNYSIIYLSQPPVQ